jgi:hypothetical protein
MATRVIMIEFNPEATATQMEVFEQELKAVADKIPYKKSFRCGVQPKTGNRSRIRSCRAGS